jgi:hypothetical protein
VVIKSSVQKRFWKLNGYETYYGHLSKYGKGIKKGLE